MNWRQPDQNQVIRQKIAPIQSRNRPVPATASGQAPSNRIGSHVLDDSLNHRHFEPCCAQNGKLREKTRSGLQKGAWPGMTSKLSDFGDSKHSDAKSVTEDRDEQPIDNAIG